MSEVASLVKEVSHWKALAERYQASLNTLQDELIDYQTGSRELEAELETQLDQAENKGRDLMRANQRLRSECDSLRTKLTQLQEEHRGRVQTLESELHSVVTERDDLQNYVRKLEQKNDALEKGQREAVASLEDFERRLNESIERNALLECEIDEKDVLQACIQRLKDETRDLRLELSVKDRADRNYQTVNGAIGSLPSSQQNGSVPRSGGDEGRGRLSSFAMFAELLRKNRKGSSNKK